MSSPATSQALVVRLDNNGTPKLAEEQVPVPKPGSQQLLVKVSHVAQNPTDGELILLRHWRLPKLRIAD
jgi:NADPH:quinone reductase-like Zn-dependent oxidoreductase